MKRRLGHQTARSTACFAVLTVTFAIVASLGFSAGFATPAAAQDNEAETDQRIVSLDATYEIDAAAGKVNVNESITVANVKGSTRGRSTITRYFWTGQTAWVPSDAENLSITSNGDDLDYTVEETVRDVGIDILAVNYPSNLNYGQTRVVDISYSLPSYQPDDKDGRRRINAAYIDVAIIVCCNFENVELLVSTPASFDLVPPSNLNFTESTSEAGQQRFQLSENEETGKFTDLIFMDWVGVDEGGLERSKIEAYPAIEIVAPPDDAMWNEDTATLVSDLVSGLEKLTGQQTPIQSASLQQSAASEMGDWGDKGPLTDYKIPRDYNQTALAATLARQWVGPGPFTSDQINTGLAIDLGAEALRMSGGRPENPGNPPTVISFKDSQAFWFMRQISNEIGHDALGATIGMAKNNETAYLGPGEPEQVATLENDWRRFLDLVQHRSGAKGAPDLFEQYFLSNSQIVELQTRNDALVQYEEIESRAGSVPLGIRTAMTNWDFDQATTLMNEASTVLDESDLVVAKAKEKGDDSSAPLGTEWETAKTVDDFNAARDVVADRDAELSGGFLRNLVLVGVGLIALAGLAVAIVFFAGKLFGRKSTDTATTPEVVANPPVAMSAVAPSAPVPSTSAQPGGTVVAPPPMPAAPTQPPSPADSPPMPTEMAPPAPVDAMAVPMPTEVAPSAPVIPAPPADALTPPMPPSPAPRLPTDGRPPMPPSSPTGPPMPASLQQSHMPPARSSSADPSVNKAVSETLPVPDDLAELASQKPSTETTDFRQTQAVPEESGLENEASLPVTAGEDASSDEDDSPSTNKASETFIMTDEPPTPEPSAPSQTPAQPPTVEQSPVQPPTPPSEAVLTQLLRPETLDDDDSNVSSSDNDSDASKSKDEV